MTELSIIVAIYKVAPYLEKCIESILKQTFRDFELILVDDGSPDQCPQICDRYARQDKRIKVLHQRNKGSVAARQSGLRIATGTYISFADGDDWLDANMYERMLLLAKDAKADLVAIGYVEHDGAAQIPRRNYLESGTYEGEGIIGFREKAIYAGEYYCAGLIPALWNKLILHEALDRCGYHESREVKLGDDAAITFPLMMSASCVVIDNETKAYHYRMVQDSLSRQEDAMYFERLYRLGDVLVQSLSCSASAMYQLKYYMLFMIESGIDRFIRRNSGMSYLEKRQAIQNVIKVFKLEEALKDIDYTALDQAAMKRIKALGQGRAGLYLWLRTCEQVSEKLRRVRIS